MISKFKHINRRPEINCDHGIKCSFNSLFDFIVSFSDGTSGTNIYFSKSIYF